MANQLISLLQTQQEIATDWEETQDEGMGGVDSF